MHNFRMLDTVFLTPATANCLRDWCDAHVPRHLTVEHLRILLAQCAVEASLTPDAEERDLAAELIADLAPLANYDYSGSVELSQSGAACPPAPARTGIGSSAPRQP